MRLEQVKVQDHAHGAKCVYVDMMTAPSAEVMSRALREMGFCYSRWEPQMIADQVRMHDVTWEADELPDWIRFPRPDGKVGQVSYVEWLDMAGFR